MLLSYTCLMEIASRLQVVSRKKNLLIKLLTISQ